MVSDRPAGWVDRLAEAMRDHEKERGSGLRSIPRYEIRCELGRGGMGVVYRAWDPQLGRDVALKVLQAAPDDAAEARERFLREAQLAARLSHPNIVAVYDIGEWEGRAYLAMQLVEGATLEKAALDLRAALSAIRDAARALDYAHQHGIVHRDIKPSNLMLDRQGRLFVTDFGLARRNDVPTKITLTGVVIGTPSYMSPEQARGGDTDARSDVYSLGATMYELVTGRSPFSGGDAMSVLLATILKEPAPPRFHNEGLPRDVETLVLKAMEKDPAKRYGSAGEMADDLQRFLDGQAILARRPPAAVRLWRRVARHPWRAVAAGALLGLLAAGGFIVRDYRLALRELELGRAEPDLEKKIGHWDRAARWFAEAESALPALRDELRRGQEAVTKPLQLREERRKEVNQDLARSATLVRERNARDLRVLADSLGKRIADWFPGDESFEQSLNQLKLALLKLDFEDGVGRLGGLQAEEESRRLFDHLSGEVYSRVADRDAPLAAAAFNLGKRRAAQGEFREAVAWLKAAQSRGRDDAELFEQRSLAAFALGNWEQAKGDYEAWTQRKKPSSPGPAGYLPVYLRLASEAADTRQWEAALGHLAHALNLDEKHPQALHDHGRARFRAHGLARPALDDLERALAGDAKLKPHRDYVEICHVFLRDRGQKDPAETLRRTSRIIDRLDGDLTGLRLERADLHLGLRGYAQAIREAAEAGGGADACRLRGQARYLLARTGPRDETLLREAVEEFGRAVTLQPEDPRAYYWRGACRHLRGAPEAAADFEKAVSLGFALTDASLQLARLQLDAGRWAEARDAASRALAGKELSPDERKALLVDHRGVPSADVLKQLRRDAFYARARAFFELEQFPECVSDCGEALALDGEIAAPYYLRGYARLKLGRVDDGILDLGEFLRRNPRDVDAYVLRGAARRTKGDLDGAIDDCTQALRINGRSPEALAGRGLAREAKGDVKGAKEDYQKALEVAPDDWEGRTAVTERLKKL